MPDPTRENRSEGARTQSGSSPSSSQPTPGPGARSNAQSAQFQNIVTYTVVAGDTLSTIATRFKVEGGFEALALLNGLADVGAINVGQKLKIPSSRPAASQSPEAKKTEAQAEVQSEPQEKAAEAATATGAAQPEAVADEEIEWLAGSWTITHYTFAMEDDPVHADSKLVSAPGLDPKEKYKKSFLGSPLGVKMQGTGLAANGRYIMYVGNGRYAYGIGGAKGNPTSWKSVAVDPAKISLGSSVIIESYRDKGPFLANDTGGAINGRHIDVFVGAVPIKTAYALGTKKSRVGIHKKR